MLHIRLSQGDGVPLYAQLVQQLKHLIATRRLAPHDELPPVRTLAQQLVVNPNTVVRAYRELELVGLIYKRRGAGTYVAENPTPYTEAECRRILGERADALLVEARNLGFDIDTVTSLLRERDAALETGNDETGDGE
jgi:GntR family transcriptional regulator